MRSPRRLLLLPVLCALAVAALPSSGQSAPPPKSPFVTGYYDITGTFRLDAKTSYTVDFGHCYTPGTNNSTENFGGTVNEDGVLLVAPKVGGITKASLNTGYAYDHAQKSAVGVSGDGGCDFAKPSSSQCFAEGKHKLGVKEEDTDTVVRIERDSRDYTMKITLPDTQPVGFSRRCPGQGGQIGPDLGFLQHDPITIEVDIDAKRFDHERAVRVTKRIDAVQEGAIKRAGCPPTGIRENCTFDLSNRTVELTFRPVAKPKPKPKR